MRSLLRQFVDRCSEEFFPMIVSKVSTCFTSNTLKAISTGVSPEQLNILNRGMLISLLDAFKNLSCTFFLA